MTKINKQLNKYIVVSIVSPVDTGKLSLTNFFVRVHEKISKISYDKCICRKTGMPAFFGKENLSNAKYECVDE